MTGTATSSLPLLDRVAGARHRGFGLSVHTAPGDGPGWRDAHAITGDPALLDARLERAGVSAGTSLRAVAVAWHLEQHAWQVASLVVATMLLDRSLPPLGPGDVRLRDGEHGLAEAIAVRPDGWRRDCSPADAAAALEGHLEPVVEALRPLRAARALWLEAGDRLGQAVQWCGEAFDRREEAWALGEAILAAPTRLAAPARFELRDGLPFRRRAGCCLSYRCDEGATCPDCPLATVR